MKTKSEPVAVRMWRKVVASLEGDCLLWTGTTNKGGYGTIWPGSHAATKIAMVHRVAYEDAVGPIPGGMQIDHLCRVRNCVNPNHLEPVTPGENVRRGMAPVVQRNKTHCPHGHAYTVENTRRYKGNRWCRACDRARRVHA